jgi:hypothetical protein
MAIWVIKDGQREGPYEEQDVRELIYEGTYSDTDPAIRDGQFDWTTLGQVLGRRASPAEPPVEVLPVPMEERSAPPPLPEEAPPMPVAEVPETEAVAEVVGTGTPRLGNAMAGSGPVQVAVVDFEMPFGSMVMLMVKWVLAMILALVVGGAIVAVSGTVILAMLAAALHR